MFIQVERTKALNFKIEEEEDEETGELEVVVEEDKEQDLSQMDYINDINLDAEDTVGSDDDEDVVDSKPTIVGHKEVRIVVFKLFSQLLD